ncbi:hypothetical protein VTH82DRAFT_4265 [Thermothelomyces myriococcoides]
MSFQQSADTAAATPAAGSSNQTRRNVDADAASVATTSSLSSRIGLLKDKLRSDHHRSSSSASSSKEQQERKEQDMKESTLRNQIRMGV